MDGVPSQSKPLMDKGSKKIRYPVEAGLFFFLLSVLGFFWLGVGPSNQELLANYAKAKDLADLIWAKKKFAWWSPNYMGGSPTVIQCGSALVHIWLLMGASVFGPIAGGKIAGSIFLGIAGLLMAAFLRRLTGDQRAAWVGAFFYALGPQAALRLAGSEHMPAVFSMPYPPLMGWALLEIAQRGSGRGSVILGLGLAAMSLTFNKLVLVFFPVVLGIGAWLYFRHPQSRASFRSGAVVAVGIWIFLGILPQLPGLRETGWMTLFSRDPLAGWQASFSMKVALSWINRDGFLFQGMPPNFTVEEGGFYLGIVAVAGTAALFWRRHQVAESYLQETFRIFAALFLVMGWLSLGPRSMVSGVQEFLKSAQGIQDWVLPLFWLSTALPLALLLAIWPDGRWKWPSLGIGLLILLLVPGFQIAAMLPFVGTIRGPWTFWQVGGVFCLASLVGIASAMLIKERRWAWISWVAIVVAAVDFSPYYLRFFQARLGNGTYEAYQETAKFLRTQTKEGAILPLSGRYFYLQLPQLSGRPISTEAFQGYFMSKGLRAIQDAGGENAELLKISLALQGVRYVFIDRKDIDTPEILQNSFRQIFPVIYENDFFTILENPSCLAPYFFSRNYVSIPKRRFDFAGADLGLIRLYFLPVELSGVEMTDPALAGIMSPSNGEVELTAAFQDRQGEPFRTGDIHSLTKEGPDRLRISLQGQEGWLTLTQAWHPDWQCSVDGQSVEIYPTTLAFPSIRIPAGSREAVFWFTPPLWIPLVIGVTLVGWVVFLAGMAYLRFGQSRSSWRLWWVGRDILQT